MSIRYSSPAQFVNILRGCLQVPNFIQFRTKEKVIIRFLQQSQLPSIGIVTDKIIIFVEPKNTPFLLIVTVQCHCVKQRHSHKALGDGVME